MLTRRNQIIVIITIVIFGACVWGAVSSWITTPHRVLSDRIAQVQQSVDRRRADLDLDHRVQAELNWYSQERGYPLCYLAGNRMVWELKREVIRANEAAMSQEDIDRRFHQVFLNAGNMPVTFLRRVFEERGLLG